MTSTIKGNGQVIACDTSAQESDHLCHKWIESIQNGTMMTSSNGNIFRVTGPLCGEFPGHRPILRTKATDTELW